MNLEKSFTELTEKLDSCSEWLLIHQTGKSFALLRSEIELERAREKILLGFADEKGYQIWRVADYKIEAEKLTLDVNRNFGREREKIRFVTRVSAAELGEAVELARIEKANQIAGLIVAEKNKTKLVRAALNKKDGRFAEIVFEDSSKKQIAALADVSGAIVPESLLTFAIFWLVKLQNRRKNSIEIVWILAEKKIYKNLRKLHALLRDDWRRKIVVKEISRPTGKTAAVLDSPPLTFANLWREKPPKLSAGKFQTNETTAEIIKLFPEKIDSIYTKHGETLRFLGLPLARVRRIGDAEKSWFGIEREKRILGENTREEFFDLLENLDTYRRFDSLNKRHEFYRLAPEAWLEAILRRNVNLLDGNLILSPVYNQFRTAGDRIDLLALRGDGRLIVIELKTSPDREMIFQAADYWRKIELQRRRGNLQKAKIFDDLEIADKPAIVYLVAPTLSFHRDFDFLSQIISPEIEIYKFELNENWRERLKVMRVSKIEKS